VAAKRVIKPGEVFGAWTVMRWERGAWLCRRLDGSEAHMTPSGLDLADSTGADGPPDLSGRTFGELTALEYLGDRLWKCRCACGAETKKRGDRLLSGQSTRCGAANHPAGFKTHAAEYSIWNSMRQRCQNPKIATFKFYGGRGITVCRAWAESFDAFLRDVGPRPSPDLVLDRIDKAGNYEPGNVRWGRRGRASGQ
jgi:hypothetical protein